MTGKQGIDVLDDGQRLFNRSPGEVTVQRRRRNLARYKSCREERADLRRENDRGAVLIIIKRLDSQTVARERERSFSRVPKSEREHPPPIRNRVFPEGP